jgi:phosphatidylserine/phosphatidylglycerophosphate/cardiolipin synthase-like enzyme
VKQSFVWLTMTLLSALSACTLASAVQDQAPKAPIQVYHNPDGGLVDAVIEIDTARSEVLVQAFDFTSAPIGKALIDAHKRGVRVEVILNSSQVKPDDLYCPAWLFSDAGITVYIDSVHRAALGRMLIIDRATVITGTFNATPSDQERSAENLLVIPSGEMAEACLENWQRHREHSELYEARK